jgi:hypothetical protein
MRHSHVWRPQLIGKLQRFADGSPWLVAQSAGLLTLTRLALFVIPFQRLLRLSASPGSSDGDRADAMTIDRIPKAVVKASRYVPGTRHCLTQALVIQFLLARQGGHAHLRIGVAKDANGHLKAHAWLESNGSPIFGVPESGLQEYRRLPDLVQALMK